VLTLAYQASIVVSAALFLFYGIACLSFEGMKRDFERFGLSHLRTLTGTLEVLGALGLIVGQFFWPPLVVGSASGLALLMLVGVATRVRVLDSLGQTLPALVLMCVNLFIAAYALGYWADR
jgi:hypothetical protein